MNLIHHTQSTCNNEQIHYSVSRSKTSQAGTHTHTVAHTLTSFSTVWKSPYYHQHIRNHSAFQMFDMNQATCHKLHLDVKQISISSCRCCKSWTFMNWRCFLREIIFTRCNERHHPLYAVWTVGKNKKEQLGIHHTSSSTLFMKPRNIFLWLKGNHFIIFKMWASNTFICISQIFLSGWSLFSCHEAMT